MRGTPASPSGCLLNRLSPSCRMGRARINRAPNPRPRSRRMRSLLRPSHFWAGLSAPRTLGASLGCDLSASLGLPHVSPAPQQPPDLLKASLMRAKNPYFSGFSVFMFEFLGWWFALALPSIVHAPPRARLFLSASTPFLRHSPCENRVGSFSSRASAERMGHGRALHPLHRR